MKITSQILSIPPYISTSWKNIASLHVENLSDSLTLIVTLLNGTRIEVPYLEPMMVEAIFAAHARYLEQGEKPVPPKPFFATPPISSIPEAGQLLSLEIPLRNGMADMGGFGTLLQHNAEQAAGPDLPPDILEKITLMSQSMGIDDPNAMPQPEPGCNCMRCQIARAMQAGITGEKCIREEKEEEEIVSDDELKFQDWIISQSNEKLYVVTNPLDKTEQYNVFLGDPVGCTCGEHHCEHIRAVLNS